MNSVSDNFACSSNSNEVYPRETNILDLNDKCLIKIFGHLNVFDWSQMAGACKRFKEIGSYLFSKNFEYFDMYGVRTHSPSLVNDNNISLDVFNGIVREFGPLINRLFITPPQHESKVCSKLAIKTISTYCTKNLRDLRLSRFKIDEVSINYLSSVLNHLSRLSLVECKFDPTVDLDQYLNNNNLTDLRLTDMENLNLNFFNRCKQIRHLFLYNVKINVQFWNQHIPNLLDFSFCSVSVDAEHVINFFRKNPQLRFIYTSNSFNWDGSMLASIGQYLPNIVLLDIDLTKNNQLFDQIQTPPLNQVLTLFLRSKGLQISLIVNKLFSHNNYLEHLRLDDCIFDEEFGESARKLHRLKRLELYRCSGISNERMDKLLGQLKQLYSLTLRDNKLTIRDVSPLLRNINRLPSLSVNVRHEDYVHIDEYKIWVTEIQKHVDSCTLFIEVTDKSKYRWIERELGVLGTVSKLWVSVISNISSTSIRKPHSEPVSISSRL